MEWDCLNYECGYNGKKQPNRCGKIYITLSSCDGYNPIIEKQLRGGGKMGATKCDNCGCMSKEYNEERKEACPICDGGKMQPLTTEKDASEGLELERLNEENNVLWAILHTCVGCKRAVPGWMYGCEIQKYINLTGICNQREEF